MQHHPFTLLVVLNWRLVIGILGSLLPPFVVLLPCLYLCSLASMDMNSLDV